MSDSSRIAPGIAPPGERFRARILVAEDNDLNFELVGDLLALDGHEVLWAKNGALAIGLIAAQSPDLLILDLQLPVVSGREVLRLLALGDQQNRPKILVLSADAMLGTREEVLNAGADAYLAKPFDLQVFRTLIGALLSK